MPLLLEAGIQSFGFLLFLIRFSHWVGYLIYPLALLSW